MKTLLLSLTLFFACSDPYKEAQTIGTVEAYDAFIAEYASSSRVFEANMAIEKILTDKARESQKPEDFDVYLNRYEGNPPTRSLYDKMVDERADARWTQALENNSVESYKLFITEYKTERPEAVRKARKRLKVAEYAKGLKLGPMEKIQVNLSDDPNGPLNGWQFETEFTNSGEKTLDSLLLRISYLNADGEVIKFKDYTAVGCGDYCQRMFVFEDKSYEKQDPDIARIRPPMKPGETRQFVKSTGDVPPDWSKQIKAEFVSIKFADGKKK